jgi:YaiO family outer membrane protein
MKTFYLTALFVVLCYCNGVLAQSDPDSRLLEARTLAASKNYDQARSIVHQLLAENPQHYDASVFEGRMLAWQGQYDTARTVLQAVLNSKPDYIDALEALTDLELWSGNALASVAYAQQGIRYLPNADIFYLKLAKAFLSAKEYQEADRTLRQLLQVNPAHAEAQLLLEQIIPFTYRYATEFNYIYSAFTDQTPEWHWVNLQQSARYKKHLINVSLNYAHRFSTSAMQYEVEAYPVLSKNLYAYTGFAYSNGIIFPRLRSGAELFRSIGSRSEVSAGFRYFDFRDSQSFIVTASLSQAYKTYLFTIRPFINIAERTAAPAGSFTAKKYLKDNRFNFVALTFNYGFVPDNPAKYAIITQGGITAGEAYPLQSSGLRLDVQHDLYKGFKIKGLASYENEEFFISKFRSRLSVGAGILYIY